MARRTSKQKEELPPPKLVENREVAHQKIQSQIEKGQQYREGFINSKEELEDLRAEWRKWSDYNLELLRRLFDNQAIADEYSKGYGVVSVPLYPSLQDRIKSFHGHVNAKITRLESINERRFL